MSRCGCSSVAATGAAMEGSDCISVTGAGTPASPFVVEPVIDPIDRNLLTCGVDGLYARAPVMTSDDGSLVIVDGAGEGDYDFAVHGGVTLFGVGTPMFVALADPPEDTRVLLQISTDIVVLDGGENGTLTFPNAFPNGVIGISAQDGDLSTPIKFAVSLSASPSLSQFFVHCDPTDDATSLAGAVVRIVYTAYGW